MYSWIWFLKLKQDGVTKRNQNSFTKTLLLFETWITPITSRDPTKTVYFGHPIVNVRHKMWDFKKWRSISVRVNTEIIMETNSPKLSFMTFFEVLKVLRIKKKKKNEKKQSLTTLVLRSVNFIFQWQKYSCLAAGTH